ncbi:MAG: FKBP-type peptidyl-prolyl cis-trans isomerase [Methanocalculaceae archaeon]|jgi:FKBP-type peptidyl-prolyl cis-trans isomerase 2|nr:FKBP-type peptidyl-prolyl cis-trans isomerase [Methanocalculaceae archaeon]
MTGVTAESTLLLHFISRRPDGEIFEDTRSSRPVQVTLGKKQINPAFEEALIGKSENETVTVTLPPEKAYGRYHKNSSSPSNGINSALTTTRPRAKSSELRF